MGSLQNGSFLQRCKQGTVVQEIRVDKQEHRVFYVGKFEEGIYEPHAFEEKTRKTSKADVDVGRSRLRELLSRCRPLSKTQESK